jgi:hypothetical protein
VLFACEANERFLGLRTSILRVHGRPRTWVEVGVGSFAMKVAEHPSESLAPLDCAVEGANGRERLLAFHQYAWRIIYTAIVAFASKNDER